MPGESYAILGMTRTKTEVMLGVADLGRRLIAQTKAASAAPDLRFQPRVLGPHMIVVQNPSQTDVDVALFLFRKRGGGLE
jgi:hypothetical protein